MSKKITEYFFGKDLSVAFYSIIVPVYNTETYLKQCIDSVLTQSFYSFELILIDDGSSDACPIICDNYAQADSRVIVVHKNNGGLSDARNAGLKIAKGEYVIFIDSDDYWDGIDCLMSIDRATKDNADIILYRAKKLFNSSGKIQRDNKSFNAITCNIKDGSKALCELVERDLFRCSACTKATRLGLLSGNNILFQENLLGEDIDWYLNVVLKANSYSFVDRDFYVYRQRDGSITKDLKLKNLIDFIYIITKWVKKLDEIEIDKNKRLTLLKYLAKEYSNLFIIYALVDDCKKSDYINDILNLSWLFDYSTIKRTRIIKIFFRMLGFTNTILLINIAAKAKSRI